MNKMAYKHNRTQIMFPADTQHVELPDGAFTLECKGGDVWVFLGGDDRILHEGDVLTVEERDHNMITMRKLYHRGHVKFKVTPIPQSRS